MSPEEYQRIKEAEKAHLRKLKQLKEAVHLLERRKSVNQALENMVGGPKALFDEQAALVEKLAMETAMQEARLEVALDNANVDEPPPTDADPRRVPARTEKASEEELLEARARSLLRQIKMEMGAPAEGDAPAASTSQERSAPRAEGDPPPPPAGLPDKTIGRMK